MKKRLIVLITAAIMLLTASVFALVGCDSDAEKVEYSVTVLSADAQPVEGATVSWQQSGKTQGSAVTDADGVAKVNIPAGTYKVTLSGIGDGMAYDDISVTPSMREITLVLEVKSVTYTATVVDKSGAAAKGVTVTWSSGSAVAGTAITGDDGSASCDLDYGDYSVTVSDLPDGNIFTDAIDVTGKDPSARFELRGGETVSYTVTVKSAGGLKFEDMTVFVYSGGKPIHSGKTDKDGVLTFSQPAGNYTADVPDVQDGYTVTKKATLTESERQGEVVLSSEVILTPPPSPPAANSNEPPTYVTGDIIHDYTFTTPYEVDGARKDYSIAELLKTKQAVVINNWGTKCSWCVKEMPAMEEVYAKYKDRIELLAISNYNGGDTESTIINYRAANDYSFPMMRDTNSFVLRFGITNFPTTIIIDRYGAIAHIESGAIPDAEIWDRLISRYVGDNYVQTFTPGKDNEPITTEVSKPDITVPADHYQKVAAAINGFTPNATTDIVWSGETENETIWPFILKTEEGVSEDKEVLCSSNSKKPNSMSALYGNVKMPVGKVLTFDYYSECETDGDILSVIWDGKIIRQISGISGGWKTCYLYTELTAGEHRLALAYRKDSTRDVGKDNVYIRSVRFEDLSAVELNTDMMRAAAYGTPEKDATTFPHYADVELKNDGYYHVKLDKLENSEYAGNDPSPMLFVNMTGVTNWNNLLSVSQIVYAVDEISGEYLVDCRLTIDGKTRDYRADIIEYCRIASASDIPGFMPVDKELHDILVAFTAKAMGNQYHDKAWLELCYFYSHYGAGETIGNPIIGLTTKTAITAEVDKTMTADVTRTMAPFPSAIYAFTPTESAVYKIQSLLPNNSDQSTQVWLYDADTDVEHPLVYSGDGRFFRDGVDEHNFSVYRYLTAGHKYYIEVALLMAETGTFNFKITNVGQSATELVPCSDNVYELIMQGSGDNERVVGIKLSGAVEYGKDADGYYHVKNADGSLGDFIYFDVMYPTTYTTRSITKLVDEKLRVPEIGTELEYYTFDFRYRIAYSSATDENGELISGYDPKFVFADHPVQGREAEDYIDYTDIIKEYIAKAETTGDKAGLVKVDDRLVKILKLFIEVRINMLNITDKGIEYEEALENEWLRFCWYFNTHDAQNP
ncbi:MAG: carboxypeptidase regulatory-like domain-containing protein [Clostridiales bacterium]|nr:carboxypeptidase regulatory-like domain-containing protein [Clostridiales bacterium]